MDIFNAFTLLPVILGAAMLFFFAGFNPLPASDPHSNAVTGQIQLKVEGLNPQDPMVPEFTLNLKTKNGLIDLPDITEDLNREINAFDRIVKDKTVPGLITYSPDLPVITCSLPPGEYYLYIQMDGFDTSLDFSISKGRITDVKLILSHIELQVPQCGFYNSEPVEFQVFIPPKDHPFTETRFSATAAGSSPWNRENMRGVSSTKTKRPGFFLLLWKKEKSSRLNSVFSNPF